MKKANTHSYRVFLKDGSVFIISDVASFHFFKEPCEDAVNEMTAVRTLIQFNDAEGEKVGHLVHANIQSIIPA